MEVLTQEQKAKKIEEYLAYCNGTEEWHNYNFFGSKVLLTDGVLYVAETAGAFWLINAILSYQPACKKDEMLSEFQVWTLKTDIDKKTAVLICERDTDDIAFKQEFEYTDFPLAEIKFYLENEVLCLPSER